MGVLYTVRFFLNHITLLKVSISVGDKKIHPGECDPAKDNGERKQGQKQPPLHLQEGGENVAHEADVLTPDGSGLNVTRAILFDQTRKGPCGVDFRSFGEPDFGLLFLRGDLCCGDCLRHFTLSHWEEAGFSRGRAGDRETQSADCKATTSKTMRPLSL